MASTIDEIFLGKLLFKRFGKIFFARAIRGLRGFGAWAPAGFVLIYAAGTVLFFSMSTSFSAAALAADGIGSNVQMMVGSGYSLDRGHYAVQLVRSSDALRRSLALPAEQLA